MTQRPTALAHGITTVSCALVLVACGSGSGVGSGGTAGQATQVGATNGGAAGVPAANGGTGAGGDTGVAGGIGGTDQIAGSSGADGLSAGSGGTGGSGNGQAGSGPSDTGGGSGGPNGGGGAQIGGAGGAAGAGAGGAAGAGGGAVVSSCVGKQVPTADPTKTGPFETTTDKGVGPVAGAPNDPIHGNTPVKFNVYRPTDLKSGGYCFPIVVWSNGHGDQPEPSAPECVLKPCGHYATLMQQFASHGFVVVVSMTSQSSQGTPIPSLTGLDWIISQSNDPTSPYYQHLDTAHIGAAGHSEGGFATCGKMASDPRITAISTVSGSSANTAIHQPALLFCGGKDPTVPCATVVATYNTLTKYPAMLIDNLAANHVSWSSQGASGPSISGLVAWFRVQLMGDTENRKYFYGPSCTFCSDNGVSVMRNSLMTP